MAEYIEREVVIRELRDVYEREFPTADGAFDLFANRIVPRVIKNIPTAEVEPVRHGRWKYYRKQGIAVCTECSFERNLDENFGRAMACPNCGARMDGGDHHERN